MRRIFYVSTLIFVLAVALLGLLAYLEPANPPAQAVAVPTQISTQELARHAEESDCWMAINGEVYDVTEYLPDHPSRPAIILAWCGREASEAYRTKGKGKAHSAAANQLLTSYRIGSYAGD